MIATLSPRLQALADWIPKGRPFADIGTDHAQLPALLVQQGHVPFAIASDLREAPLSTARATLRKRQIDDNIEFRQGDGCTTLAPGEVETVVLAGMGGCTIRQILAEQGLAARGITRAILQPNTEQIELRVWLKDQAWDCCHDQLLQDNKQIYEIMVLDLQNPAPPERWGTAAAVVLGPRIQHQRDEVMHEHLRRKQRWLLPKVRHLPAQPNTPAWKDPHAMLQIVEDVLRTMP